MSDVLFEINNGVGEIILNRPAALNALNFNMVEAMTEKLLAWKDDASIKMVVLRATPGRAFCAGGDIRAAYDEGSSHGQMPEVGSLKDLFFRKEYFLDHMIHTYPKPYISLIDGINMGGGLGISMGGVRVITENALMAMPETGIGLFPDVGGSYFLNQCPGHIGRYLGLTGYRLDAQDCLYAGFGTHFIESKNLDGFLEKLRACGGGSKPVQEAKVLLGDLQGYRSGSALEAAQKDIDDHFKHDFVEGIISSLESDASEFAQKALKMLSGKSPTSLKVTLEQLRRGKDLDIAHVFRMEYRLTQNFMAGTDFFEGVRALLVDKDKNPQWSPATLADVGDDTVASYFESLGQEELHLSDDADVMSA